MTGKTAAQIGLIAALLAAYCYFFTDWFKRKTIQIIPANRMAGTLKEGSAAAPITFTLNGEYKLTDIKVIDLKNGAGKGASVMWHLISKSNSVPTRGFLYGMSINGMKPAADALHAADLAVGEPYRIEVAAGRAKGQADFRPVPKRMD